MSFNPCTIAYLPGPGFPGADAFYANIRAWRTRFPLILFSEHQWDADTILLRASPDILGESERRHAKSNLVWLTALRILRDRPFTHFLYLEADCRVAQHEWDGKIFEEAFFLDDKPLMAGSVVCHSMCTVNMEWTRLWTRFIARHKDARFPIPCIGGTGIAEAGVPCMFLNGALGVYNLELMLKFFAPQMTDGQTSIAAVEMPAWDVAVGRLMYDHYKEAIFDGRIKHLDCVFSGYGDVQSTEKERLEWLVTGNAVAVHQVKSNVTGPMSEKDLNLATTGTEQSGATARSPIPDVRPTIVGGKAEAVVVIPSMDIFIVSFAKDAEWLLYCLRSIKKFCTGFNSVVIATPGQDTAAFELHRALFPDFIYYEYDEPPFPLGNLDHMVKKCTADEYCGADLIAHVDADCLFIRPTTPSDYLVNGKPVLLIEPFEVLKELHPGRYRWKFAVDAALGGDAQFETMCRHPAVHWRNLYPIVRNHVSHMHGVDFEKYVLDCKPDYPQGFAEFPTLGAYALNSETFMSLYHFIDLSKAARPVNHLVQGHSHPKGEPKNLDNPHLYTPDFPPEINTHRKLITHLGFA